MKRAKNPRRRVIASGNVKSGKNVGRQKVWAFAIEDFADLFDMSVDAARKAMQRGKFDPTDLRSVISFYLDRAGRSEPDAEVEDPFGYLPPPPKLLPSGD